MLTTVLVDDEHSSLSNLSRLIREHAPQLEIIAACNDSEEAVKLINERRPDVVFIDIEMPVLNGFQVLEQIQYHTFYPVFCTAYSTYGIPALRARAFDYLLKPVDINELKKTVGRLLTRTHVKYKELEDTLRSLEVSKQTESKIALPSPNNSVEYVDQSEITMIEADLKNSKVTLTDGSTHTVIKSLKDYDELLCVEGKNFLRVHNSFIVNLEHAWRYVKGESQLVVSPGKFVPVSRNKKDQLFIKLNISEG